MELPFRGEKDFLLKKEHLAPELELSLPLILVLLTGLLGLAPLILAVLTGVLRSALLLLLKLTGLIVLFLGVDVSLRWREDFPVEENLPPKQALVLLPYKKNSGRFGKGVIGEEICA